MRVVFAGGATGGHLFPGIALAEHLTQKIPNAQALFLCTEREFDRRELSAGGWPFVALPSSALTFRKVFRLVPAMARAVTRSLRVLSQFRPNLVVGLGGHGSAAPLLAARTLGIPYILLEGNSVPGRVVRLFASGARHVLAQWEAGRRYLPRVRVVGSPLRGSLKRLGRDEARRELGIPLDRAVLAVLGGSQGARALNEGVVASLHGQSWFVIHLTGHADFEHTRAAYARLGIDSKVFAFWREMALVYEAADLVVCRAGALTLQELAFFGRSAVLVPYPHAADDHQRRNAQILKQAGCAELLSETEISAGILRDVLLHYPTNKRRFLARGERLRSFFPQNCKDVFLEDLCRYRITSTL